MNVPELTIPTFRDPNEVEFWVRIRTAATHAGSSTPGEEADKALAELRNRMPVVHGTISQ